MANHFKASFEGLFSLTIRVKCLHFMFKGRVEEMLARLDSENLIAILVLTITSYRTLGK
jgi:hypothetical protein